MIYENCHIRTDEYDQDSEAVFEGVNSPGLMGNMELN